VQLRAAYVVYDTTLSIVREARRACSITIQPGHEHLDRIIVF
jgi:hypothetical protein